MPGLGNQLYLAIDAGPIHDESGKVVETLRDMTDQKRAETALQTLAAGGGLTGLANRRSFDQTLAMEWSRVVASVIGENALRPADLSARYSGEEFATIVPETDQKGARKVAERLRSVLAELRRHHGAASAGPLVTLSIGIATTVPSEEVCPDLLLTQADQALYAAKHSGRNCVVSADNILGALAEAAAPRDSAAAVTSELRSALPGC
jgi:PleD family two-component response regulator